MTKTRLKVLEYWFSGNKNNVSFRELFNFFFDKSYASKAKSKIKEINVADEFYLVYFKEITRPLYYPRNFSLKSLEQVIVESFYPQNWHYYEIPQTRVTEKDVVVDCGAAEGLFSFLVVERCEKLYLVEPLPGFRKSIERTFEKDQNTIILPVALSDKESVMRMLEHDISSSLSDRNDGIEVRVTTLDKLFYENGQKISYIKMHLEGCDYNALVGAKNLIKENKPKIAVTTYHNPKHADEIAAYLKALVPQYNILTKGIYQGSGSPIMLHAWV